MFKLRYKISEAAEVLSISDSQLRNLINDGSVKVHQDTPGGDRYVSHESLMSYVREREEQPVIGKRRMA